MHKSSSGDQFIDADPSTEAMEMQPPPLSDTDISNRTGSGSVHAQLGWRPVTHISSPVETRQQRSTSNPLQGSDITSPVLTNMPVPDRRMKKAPHTFKCPLAPEVLKHIDPAYRNIDEFKYCSYTPVICQPEEFALPENHYTLRPRLMGRRTEILIAITIYNESDEFLIRTLTAVFKNVRYFCQMHNNTYAPPDGRPRSSQTVDVSTAPPTIQGTDMSFIRSTSQARLEDGLRGEQIWTENGWQKIVVCIIADGRTKCHERVMMMLQAMGVFQGDVIMKERIDPLEEPATAKPKPVTAHIYEYSCQAMVESDLQVHGGTRQGLVPVQMMFCLKEKNLKKLNSHKWLFRAIAPVLNPYVCVLIDVGTRPKTADAIYNLWKCFDRNLTIAGVCGEITVMLGKGCTKTANIIHPLVASQNFEYKMSNMLDKSLESCFGYISVLPGAFSAYRWEALQDTNVEEGPLVAYFKGETPNPKGNVFTSNMYLAEDRILCFELVAKRNCKWKLHYCKDSVAETDVPSSVAEFISQRRRWLNGTLFCQIYAVAHMGRFWSTSHSFGRKMMLMLQYVYYMVNLLFGWFGLANFYLSFYLLSSQSLFPVGTDDNAASAYIFDALRLSYIGIIICQFICALGNRPQGARAIFVGSMVIFGLIMAFMVVVSAILIVKSFQNLPPGMGWIMGGGTSRDLVISIASTYGIYILTGLLFGEVWHVISCILQYLLLLPSYMNTLTIYAFCNSHDVSWGTKGDNKASSSDHGPAKISKATPEELHAEKLSKLQPPFFESAELSVSYNDCVAGLAIRPPDNEASQDETTKREDYYKNFRTWLVLLWVISNGVLVSVVSSARVSQALTGSGDPNATNPYMAFLMYAVALLAIIRFAGALVYLMKRSHRGY